MNLKCPFTSPITVGRAACVNAREVVRRGGAEYDCASADAHHRCLALYGHLRAVGLSAFGVEDDPTSMPHSVLVKVQTGGLAGLQRLLGEPADAVEDVASLLDRAVACFGDIDAIPVAELAGDMTSCQLPRRGRRGS